MAQERTGIVVGTNKGHVRLFPLTHRFVVIPVLCSSFGHMRPSTAVAQSGGRPAL